MIKIENLSLRNWLVLMGHLNFMLLPFELASNEIMNEVTECLSLILILKFLVIGLTLFLGWLDLAHSVEMCLEQDVQKCKENHKKHEDLYHLDICSNRQGRGHTDQSKHVDLSNSVEIMSHEWNGAQAHKYGDILVQSHMGEESIII